MKPLPVRGQKSFGLWTVHPLIPPSLSRGAVPGSLEKRRSPLGGCTRQFLRGLPVASPRVGARGGASSCHGSPPFPGRSNKSAAVAAGLLRMALGVRCLEVVQVMTPAPGNRGYVVHLCRPRSPADLAHPPIPAKRLAAKGIQITGSIRIPGGNPYPRRLLVLIAMAASRAWTSTAIDCANLSRPRHGPPNCGSP